MSGTDPHEPVPVAGSDAPGAASAGEAEATVPAGDADGAAGLESPSSPVPLLSTPGRTLRDAREARGLSQADVAEVLRFSTRQIELLESDQYEILPGATVVRGFVRSYAKLVKLDPIPLLDGLEIRVPSAVTEVRPPEYIGEAESGSAVGRAVSNALPWSRLLAGSVLIVAVALVAYFLFSAGLFSPPAAAPATPAAAPQATVAAPNPVVEPAGQGSSGTQEAVMPPPVALIVEFDGHSWIEVKDGMQKVVFVGEYGKGTRQVIEGQAPFQLWIGKASQVRVTFGERTVDLKPHTREDVARLSVE